MENEKTFSVEQSKMFQEIWKTVLFTKAQNETILQNQVMLNFKLMAIIDHLNIKLDKDWKLNYSKFFEEGNEIIMSNFRLFFDTSLENMGVEAGLLKREP